VYGGYGALYGARRFTLPVRNAGKDSIQLQPTARRAQAALRLESDSAHDLRLELMVARADDDPNAKASTAELTDVRTYALKDFASNDSVREA
jgi:hypothetical protein